MNFLKSDVHPNKPGVPLPWTDNQDAAVVRKRAAGCAVMDKLHDRFNFYSGGLEWGDEDFHVKP